MVLAMNVRGPVELPTPAGTDDPDEADAPSESADG